MSNYRYVSQGEFYVTTDPNTILVTSGMTDCIAIAFIDKKDPNNRMLSHLDEQILASKENAIKNLQIIEKAFKKQTQAAEFEVYILGGHNELPHRLDPALAELEITITKAVDINEFCDLLNVNKIDSQDKCNIINADATLICNPSLPPDFISYNNYYFDPPLSEEELASGKGLSSLEEQEEYEHFFKMNEEVRASNPELSQRIRTSLVRCQVDPIR